MGSNSHANPFGGNHPFFGGNNGQNGGNDPFAVFNNDPFFTQQQRRGRNHNQAPNNQSGNENPFNDPFFQQGMQGMSGMPPMVNMNMMINNMMMGGGDMMIPFGLMRHHRPRVADQGNVDALPTDTYKVNETASTNEESKEDDE